MGSRYGIFNYITKALDYKFMGKVPQPWTTEELMAFLDWSSVEDAPLEEVVRKGIEANGFGTRTRGPGHVWAAVNRDIKAKNRLYGIDEML